MSLQTWEEHAPNQAAFLRYLDRKQKGRAASDSIYRIARRRGFLLALSFVANVVLLAMLAMSLHYR